jgi:flagellar hook assembly protein FlgD
MSLQAVPNPFNPRVTLQFDLPAAAVAHLEIFDLRGRLVADLGEKHRQAGAHSATWDGIDREGRDLPSGVYLARLRTPDGAASRKIVLAR